MESTGSPGRIHASEATAELLRVAGKQSWIIQRSEKVSAKGKGTLQTYWVCERSASGGTATDTASQSGGYSLHSFGNSSSIINDDDDDNSENNEAAGAYP